MTSDNGKPWTMLSLVRDEAVAYLKLGLLAPMRRKIIEEGRSDSDLGVLFVPGVGANGAQFLSLKRALLPYSACFDSFEYWSIQDPRKTARDLGRRASALGDRGRSVLLVGHSLGGVLGRLLLQSEDAPECVVGFVAICAPLHGTWMSRLAPHPRLRALSPDSALLTGLAKTAHRLERFGDRILTIGTKADQFVKPHTSAFLDGHPQLLLDHVAHAGSLFDPRVAEAVASLAGRLSAAPEAPSSPRPAAHQRPQPTAGRSRR